jgi:hypothetical protein
MIANCRRAMAAGAHVLPVERHLAPGAHEALPVLLSDLEMPVNVGGRERTTVLSTVRDYETGRRTPIPNDVEAMRGAIEEAGIELGLRPRWQSAWHPPSGMTEVANIAESPPGHRGAGNRQTHLDRGRGRGRARAAASSLVGGRTTSPARRGRTPGCARRRGTNRAARPAACAVPRAFPAGRPAASRRRPAGCAFSPPAWPPPPRQAMRRATPGQEPVRPTVMLHDCGYPLLPTRRQWPIVFRMLPTRSYVAEQAEQDELLGRHGWLVGERRSALRQLIVAQARDHCERRRRPLLEERERLRPRAIGVLLRVLGVHLVQHGPREVAA